ncbi:hypothetical protein EV13_2187 [Prochlorococcus sp. MIT 0702]|nr:hypothetical protein EV12_3056 [Prochlorococcus sp. MIT 0701]KGG27220.1 hypothetical protein EV13_2187 [Prochlorococcus sp. MIT 0702]KGG29969.1 hypothetical protein EV14_3008 [Prochlorococcus sp. MIT 0703]
MLFTNSPEALKDETEALDQPVTSKQQVLIGAPMEHYRWRQPPS